MKALKVLNKYLVISGNIEATPSLIRTDNVIQQYSTLTNAIA